MATFASQPPTHCSFEGKDIQLWAYDQLTQLSSSGLKTRALNLRDAVGEQRLPRMPRAPDRMIRWILEAQCSLCEAVGTPSTLTEFGMPRGVIQDTDDVAQAPPPTPRVDQRPSPLSGTTPITDVPGFASPPPTPSYVEAPKSKTETFIDARAQYYESRRKNQAGSNIFG